jgi:N,N'-diacetyllegionaminate synthase
MHMVKTGGAIPMASVWSKDMLTWADPHIPIHKVGSGDLTCYPILSALAITGKPIILSTGLSSLTEVSEVVS